MGMDIKNLPIGTVIKTEAEAFEKVTPKEYKSLTAEMVNEVNNGRYPE